MAAWSAPAYRLYEHQLHKAIPPELCPRHVGVILDGHRRFARSQGHADYTESYRTGMEKLRELLGWCAQFRIPAVTAWVLSTDNLHRPGEELEPYFEVLVELLQDLPRLAGRLGCSVKVIGSLDLLPSHLATAAKETEDLCPPGMWRFNLALGYGGRQEIVDACRSLVGDLVAGGVPAGELAQHIDKEALSSHLYAADLPDPDLVIRTSGEVRLSGFLLWQSAYAECIFVDPYWPAFRRVDFMRALRDFARRERRFGQ
jgi:short-chain Z-isoprenyl diphosphate synthase